MQPPRAGDSRAEAGAGGVGGNTDMTPVNPTWVEGTITFNGETWTHVGVRYKGNSTLTRAWQSGSAKLPLKLDFDQFEDDVSGDREPALLWLQAVVAGQQLG